MRRNRQSHEVRNALLIVNIIIVSVFIAIGLLIVSAIGAARDRHITSEQVKVQKQNNLVQERETKVNAYATCLRRVDSRKRIRIMLEDELTIFVSVQMTEQTSIQKETTKKIVSLIHERALEVLPNTDCSKFLPSPPMTSSERRGIELPLEPIPPLTIPN